MEAVCSVIEVEPSILGSRLVSAPESFIKESKSGRGELSRDRWRKNKLDAIDQCRLLVHRLFLSPHGVKSVIFSGITPRSGCTSIVFSTAETMAVSTSGSVCVVDANAHSPYLHNLFDLSSTEGLSEALMENRPAVEYAQRLDKSNLWVLPYGRQPIIDSERRGRCFWMRNALTQLAGRFDYVLVDAPPASHYSDAITLGSAAGGIALVMEAGKARRDIAAKTTTALKGAEVRVLGVVLTGQNAG